MSQNVDDSDGCILSVVWALWGNVPWSRRVSGEYGYGGTLVSD